MNVKDLFLDLISYDTASDIDNICIPSTPGQRVLGSHIVEIMKEIGISDAFMDKYGYVYGTIEETVPCDKTVGFIAHMDTYSGVSGKDVQPQIVENYDGNILELCRDYKLDPSQYPSLTSKCGKTLITTDGTTLLGGDDKAGIAEILAAAKEIIDENRPHGKIKIAFTPDEEIGRGADKFDIEYFGCDYAYTVDGGALGEIEYENFNAAFANITVSGKSMHTGSAKGKLVNSMMIAIEFDRLLPHNELPEYTEGYEGFHHLDRMSGDVETTTMRYLIRDHDLELFNRKKRIFESAKDFLNAKYSDEPVTLSFADSYFNMRDKILPCMEIVDDMKAAMVENNVSPVVIPIRGGTDGSRLSYMGLPCPNIFTGSYNAHSRFEYAVVEEMESVKDIIKTFLYNCVKVG